MRLAPNPRRALIVGSIALAVCEALIVFGAFACAAGLAYGTRYTLWDALPPTFTVSLTSALQDCGGNTLRWFVPSTVVGWFAYLMLRNKRIPRRVILTLALLVGLIPNFLSVLIGVIVSPVLPLMLTIGTDGEHFSEGWVCWGALPICSVVILSMLVLDLARPQPPEHLCRRCGYDLTGTRGGTCPECGHKHPAILPPRAPTTT